MFKEFWEQYRDEPMLARSRIISSVCPQIFGAFYIKLGVLLTVIGGVAKSMNDNPKDNDKTHGNVNMNVDPAVADAVSTRKEKKTAASEETKSISTRGECHMLLAGDPGTGKSQFLKFAALFAPRSVCASGVGISTAGLTVSASRHSGGDWVLEAGALVLADGGVCCIDEFSCIKETDRVAVHEAMEQQTISVAKAGMICKLNARTSILATTNLKGDIGSTLEVVTGIATPLLSRFDLIFILCDEKDKDWDENLSTFILDNGQVTRGADIKRHRGDDQSDACAFDAESLRAYVLFIKGSMSPGITVDAQQVLMTYYRMSRQSTEDVSRISIRMLESLIRLTQAHARLMWHTDADVSDACTAAVLMDLCNYSSPVFPDKIHYFRSNRDVTNGSRVLRSDFPPNPDAFFKSQVHDVLYILRLDDIIERLFGETVVRHQSPPPDVRISQPVVSHNERPVVSRNERPVVGRSDNACGNVSQKKRAHLPVELVDIDEVVNNEADDLLYNPFDDVFDV